MTSHLFTFTVEHTEDTEGKQTNTAPLTFAARTHEDLFTIAEKIKNKLDFDANDATTFAVGLKLFGEMMIKHRDNELFHEFKPHFTHFMKELKKS